MTSLPGHPDPCTREPLPPHPIFPILPPLTPIIHMQPARHWRHLRPLRAPEERLRTEHVVPLPNHPGWGDRIVWIEEPGLAVVIRLADLLEVDDWSPSLLVDAVVVAAGAPGHHVHRRL